MKKPTFTKQKQRQKKKKRVSGKKNCAKVLRQQAPLRSQRQPVWVEPMGKGKKVGTQGYRGE